MNQKEVFTLKRRGYVGVNHPGHFSRPPINLDFDHVCCIPSQGIPKPIMVNRPPKGGDNFDRSILPTEGGVVSKLNLNRK